MLAYSGGVGFAVGLPLFLILVLLVLGAAFTGRRNDRMQRRAQQREAMRAPFAPGPSGPPPEPAEGLRTEPRRPAVRTRPGPGYPRSRGRRGDVLDELSEDHEELIRLFRALFGVPIKDPERKRLLDRAAVLLVEHDAIEEACVYPALRDRAPGGTEASDAALRDHAETDVQLRRLHALDERAPGFDRQVALLDEHVTGHIGWEEAGVYELLRETLSQEELDALGSEARAMRARAPHEPTLHTGIQPPPDPFTPPEPHLRERLHDLLTPAGGWRRAPR